VVGPERPEERPALTRVLVADEDGDTRVRIAEFTQGSRFDCLLASGFDEALRFGTHPRERIDILLTSVMLLPYHGVNLANRLKGHNPGMKAVFMSGLDSRVLHASGILVPGAQLLAKPFAKSRLLETLEVVRRRGRTWIELGALSESA
jgi:two-component system, cell cycle sensor histidine kinase and response regulator CckA